MTAPEERAEFPPMVLYTGNGWMARAGNRPVLAPRSSYMATFRFRWLARRAARRLAKRLYSAIFRGQTTALFFQTALRPCQFSLVPGKLCLYFLGLTLRILSRLIEPALLLLCPTHLRLIRYNFFCQCELRMLK